MSKEAMKLALEGAANYIDALGGDSRKYRQALAEQQAQQEPVAWPIDGDTARRIADKVCVSYETVQQVARELVAMQPAQPQHLDDQAVDRFAVIMKDKLAKARAKGRGGWETCSPEDLSRMLREHVEKGDPRDVANFCMMLWSLGAGIVAPQQEPLINRVANKLFGDIEVSVPNILPPKQPTESVLIDGDSYTVPAQVAAEILRLHLEIKSAQQEFVCSTGLCHYKATPAQPQQEPVANAKAIAECLGVLRPLVKGKWPHEQALEELAGYTSPPSSKPWVGLTDDEILYCVELENPKAIAEEVEAKLKEKNT